MEYHIRSCDFMRFFRDDLYMAGRLLQWVALQVDQTEMLKFGRLVMNISNFHVFNGDRPALIKMVREAEDEDQWY